MKLKLLTYTPLLLFYFSSIHASEIIFSVEENSTKKQKQMSNIRDPVPAVHLRNHYRNSAHTTSKQSWWQRICCCFWKSKTRVVPIETKATHYNSQNIFEILYPENTIMEEITISEKKENFYDDISSSTPDFSTAHDPSNPNSEDLFSINVEEFHENRLKKLKPVNYNYSPRSYTTNYLGRHYRRRISSSLSDSTEQLSPYARAKLFAARHKIIIPRHNFYGYSLFPKEEQVSFIPSSPKSDASNDSLEYYKVISSHSSNSSSQKSLSQPNSPTFSKRPPKFPQGNAAPKKTSNTVTEKSKLK